MILPSSFPHITLFLLTYLGQRNIIRNLLLQSHGILSPGGTQPPPPPPLSLPHIPLLIHPPFYLPRWDKDKIFGIFSYNPMVSVLPEEPNHLLVMTLHAAHHRNI